MLAEEVTGKSHLFDEVFLKALYESESQGFFSIILKVASRCNLACTYCYWFRDSAVYQMPGVMKMTTFNAFLNNLTNFLKNKKLPSIRIIFHGGEPLLLKKEVLQEMCESLNNIDSTTKISFGITTNGVLIDDEYAELFKKYNIGVSISLDANKVTHDKSRITTKGEGSYDDVIKGIRCLQRNRHRNFSILCVCDVESPPQDIFTHIFEELNIKSFDVLIPDFNHDDLEKGLVQSIAAFYIELLDIWLEKYWLRGVRVRILESFIKAVFLQRTRMTGVGVCPIKVVNINPDGTIEPYDTLRINGNQHVKTGLNFFEHSIGDILSNDLWLYYLSSSLTLPDACHSCDYKAYCRGGSIIHRYSSKNGYNNPSVHCEALKKIYAHVLSLKPKLYEIGMIEK